jgi:hypothetical protein
LPLHRNQLHLEPVRTHRSIFVENIALLNSPLRNSRKCIIIFMKIIPTEMVVFMLTNSTIGLSILTISYCVDMVLEIGESEPDLMLYR